MSDRIQSDTKAEGIVSLGLVHVVRRDERGRVLEALVPASEGRVARVGFHRKNDGLRLSCVKCSLGGDQMVCEAQQFNRLCYHVKAALAVSVKKGGRVTVFDHRRDALADGGKVYPIWVHPDGRHKWWVSYHAPLVVSVTEVFADSV